MQTSSSISFIYAAEYTSSEHPLAPKLSAVEWLMPVFFQRDTQWQSSCICTA